VAVRSLILLAVSSEDLSDMMVAEEWPTVRNTTYTDAISFSTVLLYAFIVAMMDILYLHLMLIVPFIRNLAPWRLLVLIGNDV
jgi:hypothetical protein